MGEKFMIDPGLISRNSCAGRREDAPESPAYRIGKALTASLDRMGYETLFASNVPELNDPQSGSGRPSKCAGFANQWGADGLIRICIRAAKHPQHGSAEAMVYRRHCEAWGLADGILKALDVEGLHDGQILTSPHMILLRKSRSPAVILVLRLPFRQKEQLTEEETVGYADAIAKGIGVWAERTERDC